MQLARHLFLGTPLFISSLRNLDHAKLQAGFYPTVPGNPPEWAQNYQILKQVAPDPAAAWRGPRCQLIDRRRPGGCGSTCRHLPAHLRGTCRAHMTHHVPAARQGLGFRTLHVGRHVGRHVGTYVGRQTQLSVHPIHLQAIPRHCCSRAWHSSLSTPCLPAFA